MTIAALLILVVAAAVFLYAAWTDFMTWKIPNRTVLILLALYVPFAFLGLQAGAPLDGLISLPGALAAAGLLFALGFALWMFKLFGAGDAKLMAPVGLFVGWDFLLPYAIGLIVFAVVMLLAMKAPLPYGLGGTVPGMRLNAIRATGKVPYGVVMVAALLAVLWMKYGVAVKALF